MRKLSITHENFFDNFLYCNIENIDQSIYKAGLTPNMLTTFGNIFTLITLYFIWHEHYVEAAFMFLFSYVFDCLDGYIARKYDMVTVFGDYYDHISDIVRYFSVLALLAHKNFSLFKQTIVIVLLFTFLFLYHMYCQELLYDQSNDSPTLDMIQYVIPSFFKLQTKEEAEQCIMKTKYFGNGSLVLVICMMIILYKFQNQYK